VRFLRLGDHIFNLDQLIDAVYDGEKDGRAYLRLQFAAPDDGSPDEPGPYRLVLWDGEATLMWNALCKSEVAVVA